MEYKMIPIGIDNFEEVIKNNYYYIDKTLLITQTSHIKMCLCTLKIQ